MTQQRTKKNKKILLLGSYGQTNIGDDLLMWNFLALLKKQGFNDTDIYVNANKAALVPKIIRTSYPGLHIIETYRTSVVGWLRLLKKVDFVVYGGGTIYKELYASTGRSRHSVTARMMIMNLLARLTGARVYHLNIGIGSIKSNLGKYIARRGLAAADYSVFRDEQSYTFARQTLQLPAHKAARSTDGLFLDPIWQKPWHDTPLPIDTKKYKTTVGINMLSDIPDWIDRDHYLQVMRTFIQDLLQQGNYVVLIPFQHTFNHNNDVAFMQKEIMPHVRQYPNVLLLPRVEIDAIGGILAQCDVLIGMRFHSLLLATALKVPFVAVMYDTKCERFVREIAYPHALKLEELTAEALHKTYNAALKGREDLMPLLQKVTEQHYREAGEGLHHVSLLEGATS